MSSGNAHRQDLQGLRALAVLLVVLNHAGISRLAGGYVGVDVFFVLSGFFITGLLLKEGLERTGPSYRGRAISIKTFYARRARRIIPAAALTLIVTNIAVYHYYNFVRAQQILQDSIASSLFYANIHFAAASTNYFAQAQGVTSPLQHFWSLAVEEQFYIVWPTLLALAFYLVHRSRRWHFLTRKRQAETAGARRSIGILLVLLFVASLSFSIYETHTNAQAAYFSTLARAWDLRSAPESRSPHRASPAYRNGSTQRSAGLDWR